MDAKTVQPQSMPMQGGLQFAPLPPAVEGLPPGLAYLSNLDQVIVKQKIELLEVFTGCEMNNKYEVMNNMRQMVFYVEEESGFCMKQCCQESRGFVLHFYDNNQQEVMRVTREFRCCAGCCWCADGSCGYLVSVEAPVGNVVGYVKQMGSKWKLHLEMLDANMQHLHTVWGPCCPFQTICCTADVEFPVTDKSRKNQVGMISKQWAGVVREMFTDADTFGITFPINLPIPEKALFIGTLFLVDFMCFEETKNNNSNH